MNQKTALQNLASHIWKVKTWDLQKQSTQVNSPQWSASPGKFSFSFRIISIFCDFLIRWPQALKLEDKLEGIKNFQAWKYRIGLILQENDLDKYIKDEVAEPEEAEAKEKHKKDMIRAQRIIADSIKDHLICNIPNPDIFYF